MTIEALQEFLAHPPLWALVLAVLGGLGGHYLKKAKDAEAKGLEVSPRHYFVTHKWRTVWSIVAAFALALIELANGNAGLLGAAAIGLAADSVTNMGSDRPYKK